MNKIRSLALALLGAFAVASALATTVIPPTFDQLVNQAQLIFQGTVTDVQSQWTGEGAQRHIVSLVTFKIDDSIKGDPGSTYTLRMLGGTVGDQTMEVTDAPKFVAGDRDILFVENNGQQFVPLVGIMYGRFHLQRDAQSGKDQVLGEHGKALTDLSTLGQEESPTASSTSSAAAPAAPLDANAVKAAIRSKLTPRVQ